MAFKKTIQAKTGQLCEYAAIHSFDMDGSQMTCVAHIGLYMAEHDAITQSPPVDVIEFRCDGVLLGGDICQQIYGAIFLDSRFSDGKPISADAIAGKDNPFYVLPEKPEAPSAYHVWNPHSWQWTISDEGIAMLREAAKRQINLARNNEERSGFAAFGKWFDSDDKSVQRISVVAQAAMFAKAAGQPFATEWTLADNTALLLDADQMMQLPIIMAMAADAMHQKARTLKAAIDSAITMEEIDAIAW